jgi:hypothetical protein
MRLKSRFISFIARPPIVEASYARRSPLARPASGKDITNRPGWRDWKLGVVNVNAWLQASTQSRK